MARVRCDFRFFSDNSKTIKKLPTKNVFKNVLRISLRTVHRCELLYRYIVLTIPYLKGKVIDILHMLEMGRLFY